jgi:hypothetical protein
MRTYIGTADGTAGAHTVEVHETIHLPGVISPDHHIQLIGLLTHHVKHSPTGFSWGYGGSGPAELARCILIDHLADDAWCDGCAGTGQQVWQPQIGEFVPYRPGQVHPPELAETVGACIECLGERTSFGPNLYRAFKREFLAALPPVGRWEITSDQLNRWLVEHRVRP